MGVGVPRPGRAIDSWIPAWRGPFAPDQSIPTKRSNIRRLPGGSGFIQMGKKIRRGGAQPVCRRLTRQNSGNLVRHRLAKFNTPLVKAVHPPQKAADNSDMFIQRQQTANGMGRAGLPADQR